MNNRQFVFCAALFVGSQFWHGAPLVSKEGPAPCLNGCQEARCIYLAPGMGCYHFADPQCVDGVNWGINPQAGVCLPTGLSTFLQVLDGCTPDCYVASTTCSGGVLLGNPIPYGWDKCKDNGS
jgi:hypothetical protein